MYRVLLLLGLCVAPLPAQPVPAPQSSVAEPPVPVFVARVVARYPHDPQAFTQGLVWKDGQFFESTGLEGRSEVRRVTLHGQVMRRATLPPDQFGEGLASWGAQLISLTWHDGIAHRWDARTLKRIGGGRFEGEGWGLASDGQTLVHSDGTATLRFLDPATLAVRRQITVMLRGRPVYQLNELEMVDGQVLANVWHTPYLLRIDPASGRVASVIDLRPVVAEVRTADPEAVANGIAWDSEKRRLFVTGKLWPTLFEIALDPLPAAPAR
jgi:glutamine cyclotransferase